ncbi:MAG TPA: KEOPS complex N(6)-L-threonylcarbamoyladenine synthase Kae1 [Candidatus Nanoarchaeia archaeon]|nr:KEOPS complex N(6)-L-threonylcarbamoyladenine synthase Kae1 [Candidatus Nanoarchaeia archaeon]
MKKHITCLGIETTSHTFGVGIIDGKGNIFADIRDMYKGKPGWGIIPSEAAQHHKKYGREMIKKALEEARTKGITKIDLVAYSAAPGLAPCLHAGINAAKEIAEELNADLIGVNHCLGHFSIGNLFVKMKDPVYIFVSGANTQIVALEAGRYRIFGETLDTGMGNVLDKFGRELGIGFPAGPKIEEMAKKGSYIEMPYVVKGMDLSFSGILTKSIDLLKKGVKKEDICYSMQETLFAMLTEVTERAMAHCNKKEALLIGGVAANKRLCEMLDKMCKARNAKFGACPLKYSGDNGLQIAWQAIIEYNSGKREKKSEIRPYERVDEVEVTWA